MFQEQQEGQCSWNGVRERRSGEREVKEVRSQAIQGLMGHCQGCGFGSECTGKHGGVLNKEELNDEA